MREKASDGGAPPALLAAMADPGFYDHGPDGVTLHETHISWVFVAGDLAFKVKKPLRLPFLDYGSLERRRLMCQEEVRLNLRLAPDYYLGVRSAVELAGGGYALAAENDPAAVEYVVEMRAVPAERTLERLIAEDRLRPADLVAIAERLADFHRRAVIPEEPGASVPRLIEALEENVETLRENADGAVPPARIDSADRFVAAFLEGGGREQLERRAAAGLVRDGHGDLRAEHVLVTDPIQVYDCVEFDRGLREIDVAADVAFLVMDLERLAGREPCERLAAAYRGAGGDLGDPPLLAFLASYRAWVRAKVALFDPDRSAGRRRAAELHALGHRLAWRARLPLALWVCGGAASGKSTLAAALADVSGLPVVDADRTRKRLAGLSPTERASSEHYSSEFNRRTHRELGAAAAAAIDRDGGVIIDATGRHRVDRDSLRDGLGRVGARLVFARCEASEQVLLERARAREADPDRVSDAGVEEVTRQVGGFEPLDEVAEGDRARIDTEAGIEEQVAAVESLLDRAILGSARSGNEARAPRR